MPGPVRSGPLEWCSQTAVPRDAGSPTPGHWTQIGATRASGTLGPSGTGVEITGPEQEKRGEDPRKETTLMGSSQSEPIGPSSIARSQSEPLGAYALGYVHLDDHCIAGIRAPGQVLEQLPGGAVMEHGPSCPESADPSPTRTSSCRRRAGGRRLALGPCRGPSRGHYRQFGDRPPEPLRNDEKDKKGEEGIKGEKSEDGRTARRAKRAQRRERRARADQEASMTVKEWAPQNRRFRPTIVKH